MKSKLPRNVLIGGVKVKVVVEKAEDDGEYDFDQKKITISDQCDEKWETLRHEMLHAALGISGVAYSKKYEDEAVVRCIENIFFPAWDKIDPQRKGN